MRRLMDGLLGVLFWAGPLLAQTYEEPARQGLSEKSAATEWLITGAFLAGCLVVGFKPAKRSNLK